MMWAAEWRMTSRPSGLSSLMRRTVHSAGSGRWKSMTSPFTLAATTTLARPFEIDSATWRALVPSGYSLTDPSGRVTFTDIGEGNPTELLKGRQGPRVALQPLKPASCALVHFPKTELVSPHGSPPDRSFENVRNSARYD